MPIGAFALRTRLSQKALRLYDELGLLAPASVDPWTGYRAYAQSQVARARLIRLLRGLAMPLERIKRTLDLPSLEAAGEVRAYWQEIEASHAVRTRLAAYVERYLDGRGDAMYSVSVREVPAQHVVSMTRNVVVKDLVPFIMEAYDTLAGRLNAASRTPQPVWFVVYHGEVNEDSDGPVEVCLPYTGPAIRDLEGEGVVARTEPAHREAYTTITRAQTEFPTILEAYSAVERWIADNQATITDSPREVYFVEGQDIAPEDPFCDVAFPVVAAEVPAAAQSAS
jgi:DNA-binding transcriptional MerR regulator